MSLLDSAKIDMTAFLVEWGESISTKRVAVTYDSSGIPTETWNTNVSSTTADRQPLSGRNISEAIALKITSTDKWYFKFDEDVLVNDRIYLGSDYYRVDYVKSYEDHLVAYTTKNGN